MKYVPSLTGVRAIAILGVLGFYATPRTLHGGFTGVDVFFVLSGYLITSVILNEIRSDKFTMREFYLRRIQRLLPNAALMIVVTVALFYIIILPLNAVKVAQHGLWALFNLSNFYILRNFGGYWGDLATSAPLLHTWSLAIEEQFYLTFPMILLLLSRRARLFAVMVCLSLASFVLCIYGTWTHPTATFYLLPTRAWEILLGAALATYLVPATADRPLIKVGASLATELAGWGGLGMIVAGYLFIPEGNHFPGAIALIPTIGTLLLLVSIANGETGPARLLSKPFAVVIGELSYSLYIWFWPLMIIGKTYASLTGRSQRLGGMLGAAVGVGLAVIAYWAVERPLRRRGPGRRQRLFVAGAAFSTCVIVCLTLSLLHPIADPLGHFDRPAYYGLLYSVANVSNINFTEETKYADVLMPERPDERELWMKGGIIHNWGKGRPRLVVIGSSHAIMYGRLIDDTCKQLGISVAFLSADATPLFSVTNLSERPSDSGFALILDSARRKWISEWNPDAVLVIDRWDVLASEPADFNRGLRELIGELAPHTGSVILFSQVPVLRPGQSINMREYVTWYLKKFGQLPTIAPDSKEPIRKSSITIMEAVAHDFPKVHLLRVDTLFYRDDDSVRYSSGRSFLYIDDNHLSEAGADLSRDMCRRAIIQALVGSDEAPPGARLSATSIRTNMWRLRKQLENR